MNFENQTILPDMFNYFNFNKSKQFLQRYIGDMSQVSGLKRYTLTEGKAKGIEAVDVKTGSGLSFTVLPGRGMDIAWADFRGIPFSYISKTGIVSPEYYESTDVAWLRTFFGGLLTTCGLSNAGVPSEEEHAVLGRQQFGLHGRISNMAADNVCVNEEWKNDEFILSVSGRMRESILHGENLVLTRTVKSYLGARSLFIHDTIENEGTEGQPLMILYHINIGYPVIDEKSLFICNSKEIIPVNSRSLEKKDVYHQMQAPERKEPEHLFFHDFKTDKSGMTACAIINPELQFGVFLRYKKSQLPAFSQWKMMAEAEYVLGMEPGNCNPVGRNSARKDKTLEYLKAGDKKEIDLEIGILSSREEIDEFTKTVGLLQ
jgi:hypothetical protein